MKFFAHDGSTVHGPAPVPELLELPGFDGDTLVCPVGSENSADWKPALAYPPFREALLAPAPRPAPPPAPPPPPAPTSPCPRCAATNPERARYCNDCGARMDGTVETPPRAEPLPLVSMPPAEVPRPAPMPAPLSVPPAGPVPVTGLSPIETLSPLEPSFVPPADVQVGPPVSAPAPVPAPVAAAAPATDAASLRNTLLAAFIGASAASGGLGYYLLRPHTAKVPDGHEIEVTPPPVAPTPAEAPVASATAPAPSAPAAPAPAAAPAPVAPPPSIVASPKPAVEEAPPRTPTPAAAKRARRAKRKPKPAPAPVEKAAARTEGGEGSESLIESRVNSMQGAAAESRSAAPDKPAPPAPPEGDKPAGSAAAASAAPDGGFMLPGIPRPVAPKTVVKAKADAKSPPPAKPSDAPAPSLPAAGAAPAAEDEPAHQVREQFEFCSQLLSQGAFDDHFDTCLCAQTRDAAPYRGRRGLYASAMKKAASAGKLETSATVSSIILDGAVAKVVAKWTARPDDKPRTLTERWQLEDGLWCRAP